MSSSNKMTLLFHQHKGIKDLSPPPLLIIILIIILTPITSSAQKLDDWIRFGDEATQEGDHYAAADYYAKAHELEPERLDITFKYAQALRKDHRYKKAEEAYKLVVDEDRRGEEFPMAWFWLGTVQQYNGDYREAKRSWRKAKMNNMRKRDSYIYKKAEQEYESCGFARDLLEDSAAFGKVNHPESGINTTASEFAPFPISDSVLLFSSLRAEKKKGQVIKDEHYKVRIYRSLKEEGAWKKDSLLPPSINEKTHDNANASISPDGKRLYFSRCDSTRNCKIMMARKKEGEWRSPKPLPSPVNDGAASYTHPSVAKKGQKEILFFSSDRKGGKGRFDIWYTDLDSTGQPTELTNAGDSINTIDDEITPYYAPDPEILFFSSTWHLGLGGFDVFRSEGAPGEFRKPKNMGYPINSHVNDLYFVLGPDSLEGFLASNRKGSLTDQAETCCNDIYTVELPEPFKKKEKKEEKDSIPSITTLQDLNKFLPVTLYFHNDEPDPRTRDTTTELTYVESYHQYRELIPEYKEKYSKGLEGPKKDTAIRNIEKFFAEEVKKGVEDLELFSKLLLKELEKGQDIDLTVKGFASPLAETDYNVNLTKRRISSMVNYMSEYKGGAYIPYFEDTAANGGSLSIIQKPYGEYSAANLVSDNLNDKRNSVYSIKAALERRIQIVSVGQAVKDSTYGSLAFKKEVFDIGSTAPGDTFEKIFYFSNKGNAPLQIDSISTGSNTNVVSINKKQLDPGAKGGVRIRYIAEDKGHQVLSILFHTNGVPREKELTITVKVEEGD